MKIQSLLLLFFTCFIAIDCFSQKDKHALIIAVGDYPTASGWKKLSSANDAQLLKKTLEQQGFPSENISILKDGKATKEGILQAIQNDLLKQVKEGGIAVFHFSGHGQQMKDNNGDEIDGLDEALAAYGSSITFQKGGYEGENHLRDEELGQALLEVRGKLGETGHLLVSIDACHSGTSTRGLVTSRGTDIIMADSVYINKLKNHPKETNALLTETKEEANLASMFTLFSSAANELSYENLENDKKQYGKFSYTLCKTLSSLPSDATYEMLLNKIKLEVSAFSSRQHPQAEGNLDALVFGKGISVVPTHFSVIEYISKNVLLVNAGELEGLSKGSRVAVYPEKTKDTTQIRPIAMGTVNFSTAFDADILLDKPIDKKQSKRAKVFLKERNYGDLSVRVQLAITDKNTQKQISAALSPYSFIKIVDETPNLYLESTLGFAGENQFALYQNDDRPIWKKNATSDRQINQLVHQISRSAVQYTQSKFLRKLETSEGSQKPKINIFVKNKENRFEPMQGNYLKVGETIQIQISNEGTEGFYFTLLDIFPNDTINQILPDRKHPAADCYLEAKATYTLPFELEIEPPLGTEVLKIIATQQPLDLKFTRGGKNRVSTRSPLKALLAVSMNGNITRGDTPALPSEAGVIQSLVIEIVE